MVFTEPQVLLSKFIYYRNLPLCWNFLLSSREVQFIYILLFLGSFWDLFDLFVPAHTTIYIRRTSHLVNKHFDSVLYIIYYTFAISFLPFQSITIMMMLPCYYSSI